MPPKKPLVSEIIRRIKKGTGASVSQNVKAYVKKAIHVSNENKSVQLQYTTSLYGVNGSSTLNAFPVCPYTGYLTVAQGVGQNGRVGNSIKTRSLMFRYVLRPLAYDATINSVPQPYEVQMLFCRVRNNPTSIPASAEVNNLFQLNNASLGPQGTLEDLCVPFNKDYWEILKVQRHKIGYAENTGSGAQITSSYLANNDFKLNVVNSVNLTKYYPKTVKFNDTTNTPTTKGIFLLINVISAVSSAAIPATQLPVRIHSYIDYQYEDS